MKIKKDELKRRIQSLGFSQSEFAEKCGISKQALTSWLKDNRNAKPSSLKKIAEFLNCSISDIAIPENRSGRVESIESAGNEYPLGSLPMVPFTIQNTPELRECIKDAMLSEGVRDAESLNRLIGYDNPATVTRLLAGKLNWFPDMLSAIVDALHIKHDELPISAGERSMLAPEGIYNNGAMLTRPIPVVDWANASGYIDSLICGTETISKKWNPDTTEVIPAPVGIRKDAIALRVHGQSMEPKIHDGDKLYCEPVENIDALPSNKIVVVRFTESAKECPDCLVCKRFRRIAGSIFLTSDNPSGRTFENILVSSIAWVGKVVGKYDDDF